MVEFTINGVDEVTAQLSRLTRRTVIHDVLRALGEAAQAKAHEALEKSKDADTGAPYAPLQERTRKRHPTGVALIRSGDLAREAGAYSTTPTRLTIRAGMEYAMHHQEGRAPATTKVYCDRCALV